MKKYLAVALSLFILSGCGSSGNQVLRDETEQTVATKIKENVTTKAQIKQTFGSPNDTTFTDGGKEIWKYSLMNMSADAVNFIPVVNWFGSSHSGTKKELTILFDGNVVKSYTMSESDASVKTGVFK